MRVFLKHPFLFVGWFLASIPFFDLPISDWRGLANMVGVAILMIYMDYFLWEGQKGEGE